VCEPRPSFSAATLKILISKNLEGGDPVLRPQNLERLGLIRKIVRNKHLGLRLLPLEIAATPFGCGNDRTSGLWNARSDVTRLSENVWKTSLIGHRENVPFFPPFAKNAKDGAPPVGMVHAETR